MFKHIVNILCKFACSRRKSNGTKITYALPYSSVFSKYYNKNMEFKDVDWSDWNMVVDGFKSRIVGWYFEPLAIFPTTGHEAYPVLCAMCALVDVFTHYDFKKDWHEPRNYKEFLRKLDPVFRTKLTNKIMTSRLHRRGWERGKLRDFADVFYTGVRCSLHHHGDLAPFAGMSAGHKIVWENRNAGTSVCKRYSYSQVVFDPWRLRDAMDNWFQNYCDDLSAKPHSDRAKAFRNRFAIDFGITITEPIGGV